MPGTTSVVSKINVKIKYRRREEGATRLRCILHHLSIARYKYANLFNPNPKRDRPYADESYIVATNRNRGKRLSRVYSPNNERADGGGGRRKGGGKKARAA